MTKLEHKREIEKESPESDIAAICIVTIDCLSLFRCSVRPCGTKENSNCSVLHTCFRYCYRDTVFDDNSLIN